MISDANLFYIGIFVMGLLILGFVFTAYELKNLDETDDIHDRHKNNTSVKFEGDQ
ncbi:MAG: hypothetical protein RIC57_10025 [Balneola sp.]|jgi:hypothetical protein|tara:strand:- start:4858 stop:5022 length:165 start_codon:yes stop_codon:yes gene_type:complete